MGVGSDGGQEGAVSLDGGSWVLRVEGWDAGWDPPSFLPMCEQEARRSIGSGGLSGLWKPGADSRLRDLGQLSPQRGQRVGRGLREGCSWLGSLGAACACAGGGAGSCGDCLRRPKQRQVSSAPEPGPLLPGNLLCSPPEASFSRTPPYPLLCCEQLCSQGGTGVSNSGGSAIGGVSGESV